MNALVNTVIAAVDLAEAEGRALRRAVHRTAVSLVLAACAGVTAVAGLACLVWAAFQLLTDVFSRPAAAAILGAALVLAAGAILWTGRKMAG